MQKFTFAISVECLHSNLLTKLLQHNCTHTKYAKTQKMKHPLNFTSSVESKISTHDAHIQQQYTDIHHMPDFFKPKMKQ